MARARRSTELSHQLRAAARMVRSGYNKILQLGDSSCINVDVILSVEESARYLRQAIEWLEEAVALEEGLLESTHTEEGYAQASAVQ